MVTKTQSTPKAAAKKTVAPSKKRSAKTTTPKADATTNHLSIADLSKEQPTFQLTELIKIWFEGWKKTFTLSGRSSRFELWTFLLFNAVLTAIIQLKCSYFLSERFLTEATNAGLNIDQIEQRISLAGIVFYLSFIIPLFPTGAMLIRRMHDLDKMAWKNYMEPVFMGFVVLFMLFITLTELQKTNFVSIAFLLSLCFCTVLYAVGFYGLKILIMTFFYRGNLKANEFGAAQYNDENHEEQALNLSCFYFLFVLTIAILYLTIALI